MTPPSASLRCRCFLGNGEERRVEGAAVIAPGKQGPGISPPWGVERGKLETEKGEDLPMSPPSGFGLPTDSLVYRWA